MNQPLQPELHPDAEILSAFAEHALSGVEQQQTLAHLAECSRCRKIVFLAQQSAADEQPVSALRPSPSASSAWWSNWRLIWIAAPACAALLTIAVVLHMTREKSASQQARTSAPQARQARSIAPDQETQSTKILPVKPVSKSRDNATPKAAKVTPENAPSQGAIQNLPLIEPQPKPVTLDAAQITATDTVSIQSASSAASLALPAAPRPAPNSLISVKNIASSQQLVTPTPQLPQTNGSAAIKPPAAPGISSPQTARGAMARPGPIRSLPPNPAISPMPNSARSFALNAPMARSPIGGANGIAAAPRARLQATPFSDTEAARKILYTQLPNGLTAVSAAAISLPNAQHRLLALDSAGSLFRSEDRGITWMPVTSQWTGRPLQVRVETTPSTNLTLNKSVQSCATCSSTSPQLSSPPATFQLITDTVSTWTSTDGLTWTQKTPPPTK